MQLPQSCHGHVAGVLGQTTSSYSKWFCDRARKHARERPMSMTACNHDIQTITDNKPTSAPTDPQRRANAPLTHHRCLLQITSARTHHIHTTGARTHRQWTTSVRTHQLQTTGARTHRLIPPAREITNYEAQAPANQVPVARVSDALQRSIHIHVQS